MSESKRAVVVLAAGLGTRMRSGTPKVLHRVAGEAMLGHVIGAARAIRPDCIAVVVGPEPEMEDVARAAGPETAIAVQEERLGTGHAVRAARAALGALADDADAEVLVVCGDTPLITGESLGRLLAARADAEAGLAVLGFRASDPGPYGRLILDEADGRRVARIVEAKDATADERTIDLCNSGVLCARAPLLFDLLAGVDNANAKGEYYLTDAVSLAAGRNEICALALADEDEVRGVNSRVELAGAEAAMQGRLRARAMEKGATLVAPETVFLSHDTELAPDVVVHPHVVFGPGVVVGEGAEILSFSHLEGARVAAEARIGPYARLRPGAMVGEAACVGNFVEVKNASLARGAKANHLTYLGDAEVGEGANIGAGTITCNFDGFDKHRTVIGADAFIGSNTALVAPVTVGEGAIVGAGSTITDDVAGGALAVARARQETRPRSASRFRAARAMAGKAKG